MFNWFTIQWDNEFCYFAHNYLISSPLCFRYYVISQIPQLVILDDTTISKEEREEAVRTYGPRVRTISTQKNGKKRSPKSVSVLLLFNKINVNLDTN